MYTCFKRLYIFSLFSIMLFPLQVLGADCSCTATLSRVSITTGSDGVPTTTIDCTRSETFSQPVGGGRHFRTLYAIMDSWWNNTTASVTCRAEGVIDTDTFLGFPDPNSQITTSTCRTVTLSSETPIVSSPNGKQTHEVSCGISRNDITAPVVAPPPQGAQDPIIKNDYVGIPFALPSTESVRVTSAQSLPELIGKGLRLFTGFFGSIALIMVIYGGLQIMTAAGQSEKIKQGGKIIAWASIGLITMMLSYLLVSFVFSAIA